MRNKSFKSISGRNNRGTAKSCRRIKRTVITEWNTTTTAYQSASFKTIRVPVQPKKTDVKTSTQQKHSDEHDWKRKK